MEAIEGMGIRMGNIAWATGTCFCVAGILATVWTGIVCLGTAGVFNTIGTGACLLGAGFVGCLVVCVCLGIWFRLLWTMRTCFGNASLSVSAICGDAASLTGVGLATIGDTGDIGISIGRVTIVDTGDLGTPIGRASIGDIGDIGMSIGRATIGDIGMPNPCENSNGIWKLVMKLGDIVSRSITGVGSGHVSNTLQAVANICSALE